MKRYASYPIYTHLLSPGEKLVEVVISYTKDIVGEGDTIALAESVVAITQGRTFLPEKLNVTSLARFLSLFPQKHGSLATPEAMQVAIKEAGKSRILMGSLAALFGKIIGRTGDFYRVAGEDLARIDDIAGTMWPYDKYIVTAPKNLESLIHNIKKRLDPSIDVIVVDVNDAYQVDILASTGEIDSETIKESLMDNPFGNEDQQTPIVVLKSNK